MTTSSIDFVNAFRDPELARAAVATLEREAGGGLRFMEVCGTHTVAIFQSGLHSLMPEGFHHLTGPGCPVCVTGDREVATFLAAAERDDVILTTFGDLMKVPGPGGRNLKQAQADGAQVKIIYSPFDVLTIARENPDKEVVFIGVGFETTAPTVAATIQAAKAQTIDNVSILCFHKTVPIALAALLADPDQTIEGFILPGHVSAVIGSEPYEFLAQEHGVPAVVAGFEPLDILQGLIMLERMKNEGRAAVEIQYQRVVTPEGNRKAQAVMAEVFEPSDADWRGIGTIPGSGLALREEYARFDAMKRLGIEVGEVPPPKGCRCGDVLRGVLAPCDCPLFGTACTPAKPVGPCMVSTEGSCAAYYKYKA
jgi:hydrogenase expression/formation protein HypD